MQSYLQLSKKNKNPGINLTKEGNDLYNKNYKVLMKETEEGAHTHKKDTLCSWTGRTNIVKMSILPKVIYKFDTIHIKH